MAARAVNPPGAYPRIVSAGCRDPRAEPFPPPRGALVLHLVRRIAVGFHGIEPGAGGGLLLAARCSGPFATALPVSVTLALVGVDSDTESHR